MERDENRIIARWLDAHGYKELAWEPAKTCPQGHSLGRVDIGGLCSRCVDDYLMSHESLSYYGEALEEMQRMPDSVKRMWLIEAVARDFTLPTHLLAAAEAFCDEIGGSWHWRRWQRPGSVVAPKRYEAHIHGTKWEDHRFAFDDVKELALRAALAAAIAAEGGN